MGTIHTIKTRKSFYPQLEVERYLQVSGEVNGTFDNSIFGMNPRGWIPIFTNIPSELVEGIRSNEELELLFITYSRMQYNGFPINIARSVKITNEPPYSRIPYEIICETLF